MILFGFLVPFLLLNATKAQIFGTVDVPTEYGTVRGRNMQVDNGRTVSNISVFQGIPFAKDTSGSRRWQKPERPDPYDGVLEAYTIGDACPQSPFVILITNPSWERFSEDCLHLNIYTPESPPPEGTLYPVMFWIYGGGFGVGSNFQYPGHFLATYDVVVVMVNYRLNKFGFAFCGKPECQGNYGMWDQNLALQYVRDNIVNYGGDPDKITVFGESAGAASTSFHLLSPQSKDLFHQGIMESGAEEMLSLPDNHPERLIYGAAEDYGCPFEDGQEADMMACLREASWEQIMYNTSYFGTGPNVDGMAYANPDDGFLPRTPAELREEGNIMRGPILAGHNHDDGAFGVAGLVPEAMFGCCNRTYFQLVMRNRATEMFFGRNLSDTMRDNIFRALDYNYAPWPFVFDNDANRASFVEMMTDTSFGGSWYRQINKHQEIAPVYAFIYNYRGRNTADIVPEWMGVPHLGELPYVLGFTLLPRNEHIIKDSTVNFTLIDWTEEDVEHTVYFQTLLTNFAKYGDPTPSPVPDPIGGMTTWPPYSWSDVLNVLHISNTSVTVEDGWRDLNYALWDNYSPYLSGKSTGIGAEYEDGPDPLTDYIRDMLEFTLEARMTEAAGYTMDDFLDMY